MWLPLSLSPLEYLAWTSVFMDKHCDQSFWHVWESWNLILKVFLNGFRENVTHLSLYNLSVIHKKKYFDSEMDLMVYINDNWDLLQLGEVRSHAGRHIELIWPFHYSIGENMTEEVNEETNTLFSWSLLSVLKYFLLLKDYNSCQEMNQFPSTESVWYSVISVIHFTMFKGWVSKVHAQP